MGDSDLNGGRAAVMADLFEASFIEVVQGLAVKNKVRKGAFARLAWPKSTPLVARNRWAAMRAPHPRSGKPIACSLSDAYRLAKALGVQAAYIALQAENMAEQKFEQLMLAEKDGRVMEAGTEKLGLRRHSRTVPERK